MRVFLASLATTGAGLVASGVGLSITWLILVGASALIVAVMMAALSAPTTRQGR